MATPLFRLHAPFKPTGDQPTAIAKLVRNLQANVQHQVLLGVTGSGKTFTVANVVNQIQRPTLVLAHNKTLAAQLAAEFREFFPHNAVHYFVSYYDYYQPEAYVPQTDTYIEKETQINEEIDRLRNAATQSLLTRPDVLIVASVSCIYGLGNPVDYLELKVKVTKGERRDRQKLLRLLADLQYQRNDIERRVGAFRVRGDTVEIMTAEASDYLYRISFLGDLVERIDAVDYITGRPLPSHSNLAQITVFPAKHFVTPEDKVKRAIGAIEAELAEHLDRLRKEGRLVEAQRLEQRTRFDLETLTTAGFCPGIENYSRHLTARTPGEPPSTLLDYFPDDFLLVVDESHITIPQVRSMYAGDRSRKQVLIDYGFRLPSALDNRPLNFTEFERHIRRAMYISATPGPWELDKAGVHGYNPDKTKNEGFTASLTKALADPKSRVAQQVIRPTGLLDPIVEVRPAADQVKDIEAEIKKVVKTGVRVLVTVMTKRTAEELAEYLLNQGIKVQYLHSEVDTLERLEVLTALRRGEYDVLVGINLLREGLDLPEVGLVAILDADKEGFLRSDTSLVQTMGRAARHITGRVILYADKMTGSMQRAIDETNRRREIQKTYNKKHGITPMGIVKAIKDMVQRDVESKHTSSQLDLDNLQDAPPEVQTDVAHRLEDEMELAAQNLEFEKAAALRDQLAQVERIIGGKRATPKKKPGRVQRRWR